jgi:hypothetical protein
MKQVMAKTAQRVAKEVKGHTRGTVLFCNTCIRKYGIYPGKTTSTACFGNISKIH